MFDSYESTITRGLLVYSNNLRIDSLHRVSGSCLRVDGILFERLDRLSAFKGEFFRVTVEPGTHSRYPCPRKCRVLLWVSRVFRIGTY